MGTKYKNMGIIQNNTAPVTSFPTETSSKIKYFDTKELNEFYEYTVFICNASNKTIVSSCWFVGTYYSNVCPRNKEGISWTWVGNGTDIYYQNFGETIYSSIKDLCKILYYTTNSPAINISGIGRIDRVATSLCEAINSLTFNYSTIDDENFITFHPGADLDSADIKWTNTASWTTDAYMAVRVRRIQRVKEEE